MTSAKTFDFKKAAQHLAAGGDTEICVSGVYDAVYALSVKYGKDKKAFITADEADYVNFGAAAVKAVKDAGAEYSVILSDGETNGDMSELMNFAGGYVIVLSGGDVFSLSLFYADKYGADCHAVVSVPAQSGLFTGKISVYRGNVPKKYSVKPPRTAIVDLSLSSKRNPSDYSEAYISSVSLLLSLIDYKMRILVSGEKFDGKVYEDLKRAALYGINFRGYENYKDVLMFSSLLTEAVKSASDSVTDCAAELFSDVLVPLCPDLNNGERKLTAFKKLSAAYHFFFSNDFSDFTAVADYNSDLFALKKITGRNFIENVCVISPRRRYLISEVLERTKKGLKSETAAILLNLEKIIAAYLFLDKKGGKTESADYFGVKTAMKLSPYLTDKTTVLSVMRDFGLLFSIKL